MSFKRSVVSGEVGRYFSVRVHRAISRRKDAAFGAPSSASSRPMRLASAIGLFSLGIFVGACGARPGTRSVDDRVQAPGLTLNHSIAEGEGEPKSVEERLEEAGLPPIGTTSAPEAASSSPAAEAGQPSRVPSGVQSPPDPTPLSLREQWEYQLAFREGRVEVLRVRKLIFPKPVVTERKMGRFALELWIGRELVDRVRFDFPLLATEEGEPSGRAPVRPPLRIEPGVESQVTLRVPASPRARRLVLVDRATESQTELLWPPDQAPSAAPQESSPTPKKNADLKGNAADDASKASE